MIQSKFKKHLVSWYICSSTVVDTLYWNSFAVFQVILNRKKKNHDLADKHSRPSKLLTNFLKLPFDLYK